MNRLRATIALLVLALMTFVAATAAAQTTVVVRVRGANGQPADAVVTITPQGGGAAHSCRTSGGTCRIANVPEGTYIVTAEPTAGGGAPIPRPVPVPPGTEVTIHVTLL